MVPVLLQACKLLFLCVILVLRKHSQAGPFGLDHFSKSVGFRLSSWREPNKYVVGNITADSNWFQSEVGIGIPSLGFCPGKCEVNGSYPSAGMQVVVACSMKLL